jgi:SNF2 family DNA or RNA helicase
MTETFQPFPYQIPMVEHLLANDRAALFVSPGKGKTVVTLTALDTLATCGQLRGALIVAPLRVCSITWPAQVARWAHTSWMRVANLRTAEGLEAWLDGSADIYLINSELLPNCLPQMFPKRKTFSCPVDTLVIDELSLAKNPQSKRFKVLYKHLDKIPRRWGLTGTPIPNNYLDLFMQVKMLDDGQRLGRTFSDYKSDWFYPADYMGYTYKLQHGAKEQIDRRLSDLALVMVGEASDLPASSVIDIPATMPADAAKQYRTLEKEMLAEIADGEITAPSAGVLVNKLLQMTSGAVYDADRNVLPVHEGKLDALRDLLAKHKGEPVLVLCAFKHESARILKALPQARMFDELYMPEWQAGEIPVWVADPRSLSHGIDGLQKSCRIAVWCSLTYSHETYVQTNARLVRTGQTSETRIYRIICPGTIDDAVVEALRDKSQTQSGMLHAVRALQLMRGQSINAKHIDRHE